MSAHIPEACRRVLTAAVIVIASIGSAATSAPEHIGPAAETSVNVPLDADEPTSSHTIAVTISQEVLDDPGGFVATLAVTACLAANPDDADSGCRALAEEPEEVDTPPLVRISLDRERLISVDPETGERVFEEPTVDLSADDRRFDGVDGAISGVNVPQVGLFTDGTGEDSVTMTIELVGDAPQLVLVDARVEALFNDRYDSLLGWSTDESVPGAEATIEIE